jgi:hypothetical protein
MGLTVSLIPRLFLKPRKNLACLGSRPSEAGLDGYSKGAADKHVRLDISFHGNSLSPLCLGSPSRDLYLCLGSPSRDLYLCSG